MRVTLIAVSLCVLPIAAFAQQVPSPDQLQAGAEKVVGSFWHSTGFQIVSKAFKSDPLKPTFIARFEMEAVNPNPLYLPNGDKVGPEAVLLLTVPAKTARTFYGTVDLTYSAGAWDGPTNIENPADKLGKPIDFYTVPTVVLGSDQYKQAVAQQTTFSLDAQKAELQSQLNDLQKADTAELEDIQRLFESNIQAVSASLAGHLKDAQSQLTAEFGTLLDKSLQDLADQQQRVDQTRAAMVTKQQEDLATLQLGFEASQQTVAAEIKAAQATIDQQNQLIALRQKAVKNDQAIASLTTNVAKQAKAQLASFIGSWSGLIRCTPAPGVNLNHMRSTAVNLVLTAEETGSLPGQLKVVGGDLGYGGPLRMDQALAAVFQITSPGQSGPVEASILTKGQTGSERDFLNFEVHLDPSGAMMGDVVKFAKECSVVFSR